MAITSAIKNLIFSSKNQILFKLAVRLNRRIAHFLRQRSGIRASMVVIYKHISMAKQVYSAMSWEARALLQEYYVQAAKELAPMLERLVSTGWR